MSNTLVISNQETQIVSRERVIRSIVSNTTPQIIPYLEALDYNLIKNCEDREIKAALSEGINKAIFNMGHPAKDLFELTAMIRELLQDVKSLLGTLTTGEIILACQNGSKEVYGQNFGVNVATVLRWMMGLMNDTKRHEAKKAYYEAMNTQEKPEISESELIKTRNEIILKAFEKYQSTGMYDDLGNYVYGCLKKIGVIQYTGKEVRDFIVQAIENLKERKVLFLSCCTDLAEGRKVKRDLDHLNKEEIEVTPEIQIEAKRIMLFATFDHLIFEDENLSDLLNEQT